jgi:preprotein translocase subunit SecG
MQTLILVIHLILAIALVALVLMQQSEGGALGIGGGTPFMGARSAANMLTRTTGILAALFMLTSIALTVMATHHGAPRSILDQIPASPAPATTPSAPATAPAAPPATPAAPSAPVAP